MISSSKRYTEEEFKAKALSLTSNSTAGLLNDEQQTEFLRLTVDESILTKISRVMKVNNRKGDLNRISVGSRITQLKYNSAGPYDAEGLDKDARTNTAAVRTNPTFTTVPWETFGVVVAIEMSDDFQDFTIEGRSVVQTLVDLVNAQMMNDLEEFVLLSNTALAGSDPFIGQFNGWKKRILTNGHVVDAGNAAFSSALVSRAIRAIPTKWRRNLAAMRLLVAPNTAQTYRDGIVSRLTPGGDAALDANTPLRPYGVPMVEVPLLPIDEDLTIGTATVSEGSFALLTSPTNLLTVVSRDIQIESMRYPEKQTDAFFIHMRLGSAVELEDAAAIITNLRENPDA